MAVSTHSATPGSDKLPRLKKPWTHGASYSSNNVWKILLLCFILITIHESQLTVSMMSSARPPGLRLSGVSGVAMKYWGLVMWLYTSASSSP